jgi:hypothetical protein
VNLIALEQAIHHHLNYRDLQRINQLLRLFSLRPEVVGRLNQFEMKDQLDFVIVMVRVMGLSILIIEG